MQSFAGMSLTIFPALVKKKKKIYIYLHNKGGLIVKKNLQFLCKGFKTQISKKRKTEQSLKHHPNLIILTFFYVVLILSYEIISMY